MPNQVDPGERLDQAGCLLVQRPKAFILDLPSTQELIKDELAVPVDENARSRRFFTRGFREPLKRPDQRQVLRLIVRYPISIVFPVMPDHRVIQRNLVTAVTLAGISQRSAIEHDVERRRVRHPAVWLDVGPGR